MKGLGLGLVLGVKKIFPKEGWTSWRLLRSHLNVKLEISMLSFSSSNTKNIYVSTSKNFPGIISIIIGIVIWISWITIS
jgi:hypothetical protein